MNELIIRKAQLDDRISLDELFREELVYHESLMPEIFKVPTIVVDEQWLKPILNNDSSFLVISVYDGDIVGAILYKIKVNQDDPILKERKFGYIEEMIVKGSFRRQGIGKQLLDYAIKDLSSQDIKDIEINVWENNEIGRGFYKKYGFKTIQRRMKMKKIIE